MPIVAFVRLTRNDTGAITLDMKTTYEIPAPFADQPWRQVANSLLKQADTVPTMLHRQEQKLYYWLTRNEIGGAGAVVDLGAFAGGSTARLAQGLEDAGSGAMLHAYDRFTVDPVTKQKYLYANGIAPFEGNDLLPLARRFLAPWADRVTLHPGEIQDIGWNPVNGPIAILVLDACKRTEWTDYTAQTFYPHLVAGKSVINHQDFLQWNQPWLPPHMVMMADFFEPLAFVRGSSLLFRCVRVPEVSDLQARSVAAMSDDQMIEAIRDTKRRFRGWGMGGPLDRMIAAIRLNPGERRHWEMKPPPAKG